ncbi:hypothetical protein R1sor_001731 [Riccia sorocarpa]|uniref:Uncharacterized protein n=1 Tax=Riccia sorocarpa TaxID=122646 RepID=A0ABD3H0R9_9MARC
MAAAILPVVAIDSHPSIGAVQQRNGIRSIDVPTAEWACSSSKSCTHGKEKMENRRNWNLLQKCTQELYTILRSNLGTVAALALSPLVGTRVGSSARWERQSHGRENAELNIKRHFHSKLNLLMQVSLLSQVLLVWSQPGAANRIKRGAREELEFVCLVSEQNEIHQFQSLASCLDV